MTELSLVRLTLDYGIEGISYSRGSTRPSLPKDRDVQPSGVGRRPQLEALLAMPNLDAYLKDSLLPVLVHPELLNRIQFERTLHRVADVLQALEEPAAPSDPEGAGTGIDGRDLRQARQVLTQEQELRSLAWAYLNALHQG